MAILGLHLLQKTSHPSFLNSLGELLILLLVSAFGLNLQLFSLLVLEFDHLDLKLLQIYSVLHRPWPTSICEKFNYLFQVAVLFCLIVHSDQCLFYSFDWQSFIGFFPSSGLSYVGISRMPINLIQEGILQYKVLGKFLQLSKAFFDD
jgi:hypothetical protein